MKSTVKTCFLLFSLILAGCGAVDVSGDAVPQATRTVMAQATVSPAPTATIGYQATAQAAETARVAAEGTAIAASRLMVEATAGHEVRAQEQLKMTAEAEKRSFEAYAWTATARWTAVPATQTQQAIQNTQIAAQQTMMAGQMTATHEAPTLMVAMANAEVEAQFATLRVGIEIFALFAIAMFLLFIVGFVIWRWRFGVAMGTKRGDENAYHELDVTHVQTVNRTDGQLKINRYVVPCSPDALTELAQALVSGQKSFGINSWEGSESDNFTRAKIKEVRHWMQLNRFAQGVGQGRLHPTEDGMRFFERWLRLLELPDEFEFERVNGDRNASAVASQ